MSNSHGGVSTMVDEKLEELRRRGFTTYTGLTTPEEAKELRDLISALFRSRAGYVQGDYGELTPNASQPNSPQIDLPSAYCSELHKSVGFRRASELAREILGGGARFVSDVAISKSAYCGAPTPWHQDEAFRDPRFSYDYVTFWIALQDVDESSGCLQFVPGSHTSDVREHKVPGDDSESVALECHPFADETAVSCPLRAGDCTIHFARTVHSSTPNLSQNDRVAYSITLGLRPKVARSANVFNWSSQRTPHLRAVRRRWMARGGWLVLIWRRLKRGELTDWETLRYLVTRAIHTTKHGG
jgi:Phytanoyl-CoA dioxygenase (PhyH)